MPITLKGTGLEATTDLPAQAKALLLPSVKLGAATGGIGLFAGGLYGFLRAANPIAFTGAATIQCSYYGFSVMLMRNGFLAAVPNPDKPSVKALASGSAGAVSGLIASTWQQSSPWRAAVVIGLLSAGSQLGYDTMYKKYSRAPDTTPFLERLSRHPYMPLKRLPDDEYESILTGRITKLETEISIVEGQIDSLKNQKVQFSPSTP